MTQLQWASLGFCDFSTKGQIGYVRKTKRHEIFFFFQLLNIENIELCWFTFHLRTIYFVKNYPLSTTLVHKVTALQVVKMLFLSPYGVRSPPKFMVWILNSSFKFLTLVLEFYSWIQNYSLDSFRFLFTGKCFYAHLLAFNLNSSIWPCSLCIFNSLHQIT